jgi:uncharacterized protein YcnI
MTRSVLAAICAALLALASPARAHIVVTPSEVPAGQAATFEMRVPTELDVPTTRLRLEIPDGFSFSSIEPVAGWKITVQRTGDRVTAVEAKGKLRPDFFQRFVFRGRVPTTETTLVWRVIQTYRDGTVVRWTGQPGEEEASETKVTPAAP